MTAVVIVAGARTPIGTAGGHFKQVPAWRLGAVAVAAALQRAGLVADQVDEVILGNVLTAGQGQNPARRAALAAGLPTSVAATTVNLVCGSGLRAIELAAQAIRTGQAEIVVAGGMESMSQAPYLLTEARYGYRHGSGTLYDSLLLDGLTCAFEGCHMGEATEALAHEFGIDRAAQDRFALASHCRAVEASVSGRFLPEIEPVIVDDPKDKAGGRLVSRDEHPRPDTTLERLSALRPAFATPGTITAGNASGINDGAAAVVLMSAERAAALGLRPLGRIAASAMAGVAPLRFGIGPVPATQRALERLRAIPRYAKLGLADLDLYEINEAFAAQTLIVQRELGLDAERLNVNGGAIALGHPIGASGARILVTALYELRRRSAQFALASLCIGGGMGIAMIVEASH